MCLHVPCICSGYNLLWFLIKVTREGADLFSVYSSQSDQMQSETRKKDSYESRPHFWKQTRKRDSSRAWYKRKPITVVGWNKRINHNLVYINRRCLLLWQRGCIAIGDNDDVEWQGRFAAVAGARWLRTIRLETLRNGPPTHSLHSAGRERHVYSWANLAVWLAERASRDTPTQPNGCFCSTACAENYTLCSCFCFFLVHVLRYTFQS